MSEVLFETPDPANPATARRPQVGATSAFRRPDTTAPRLSWLSIDGFGSLCGVEIRLAPSGVTTLLGPNEAGKSTIFDFISSILFGFPRKGSDHYREPVNGGRHGGRLGLVDSSGEAWVVERHSGDKRASVTRPDGSEGSEVDLTALLGGATAELFRAVFALDLDDLRQLDRMSSDEVREVLFSSSILGQRRSAARALKTLDSRREELVRARQGGRANLLAAELRACRAQLDEARRSAGRFAGLRAESVRLHAEIGARAREGKRARLQLTECELLERCFEIVTERDANAGRLTALPDPGDEDRAVLLAAAVVDDLRSQYSGHEERVRRCERLAEQRANLAHSVEMKEAQLDPAAVALTHSDAFEAKSAADRLEQLAARLEEARGALRTADAVAERAERAVESESSAAEEQPGRRIPETAELLGRRASLNALRGWISEVDRLTVDAERAEDADRRRELARKRSPAPVLAGTLIFAAMLLLAMAALEALRHDPTLGGVLAGLAALTGAVGIVLARGGAEGHIPSDAGEGTAVQELRKAAMERIERLAAAKGNVASLAFELDIALPASPVSVGQAIDEAEAMLETRRGLDERARRRADAESRMTEALSERQAARHAVGDAQSAVRSFAVSSGLPESGNPDYLLGVVRAVGELRDRRRGLKSLASEIDELNGEIGRYELEVSQLYASVFQSVPSSAGTGSRNTAVKSLLEALSERLTKARTLAEQRSALERDVEAAERAIERAIGRGEKAIALRSKLSSGLVADWEAARLHATEKLAAAEQAHDQAVREHERVSAELEALARSADIPRLELRCTELETELRGVLEEYLVLGAARFVIQSTLRRYEEERQPAVLARAGELFGGVTGGRYVRLGVGSGTGEVAKATIRALGEDGRSVEAADLSRGAMEQLYLCLRLGLAESFAERYVPLPMVLDDVLVNADPERCEGMLAALADTAERHQVLFLTCHPHLAEMVTENLPSAETIELQRI
jgi:uncharacterized protein YhaN